MISYAGLLFRLSQNHMTRTAWDVNKNLFQDDG